MAGCPLVTAAAIILHFLGCVGEAHGPRIVKYLDTWGIAAGTTKNTLGKLTKAGKVERVGRGRYRIGAGVRAANITPPLTTT